MFRFSIRDVLWLTVVVAMGLGWWSWWRSIPAQDISLEGTITVAMKPLTSGRISFFAHDGAFHGANVVEGSFHVERMPQGEYKPIIEGDEVAELYSDLTRSSAVRISHTTKALQFGLHSKEHLATLD